MIRPAALGLLLALAAASACTRPNLDVFHILDPIPGEPVSPAPPPASLALEVMPVRLPDVLQRPQLVQEVGPGTLSLMETHRWGNGLAKDIQRILVENLTLLGGASSVVAYPYGERVKATHRLEVDVHQLDGKPGGTLTLQATWMVAPPQGGPALLLRRTTLQRPIQGQGAEALVAAHSLILGDLSREIAAGLRTLPQGRP